MAEDFQDFEQLKRQMQDVSNTVRRFGADSKEAGVELRKLNNQASQTSVSLKALGTSTVGFASGLAKGNSSLGSFSSVLKSGGKAFEGLASKFGGLGKVIGVLGSTAASGAAFAIEQYEAALGTFQELSTIGAVGATGINELAENIKEAGIPLKEFAGTLARNNASLTALTGSARDSARSFAEMINTMNVTTKDQTSSLNDQLMFLGFTTDEISDTLANFSDLQRRLGTLQRLDQEAITQGTVQYGKELDLIAKLTGKSRKEQQTALEGAMREGRFLAAQRQLGRAPGGDAAVKEVQKLVLMAGALSPALESAVKDVSGGFIGTEAARQGFISTGGALTDAMTGVKNGTLSAEEAIAMLKSGVEQTLPTMEAINLAAGDSTGAFMPLHEAVNITTFALGDMAKAIAENKKLQDEQLKPDADSATQAMVKAQRDMKDIAGNMQATVLSFDGIATAMDDITKFMKDVADNVSGALGANSKVIPGALYSKTDVAIVNSEATLAKILSEIQTSNTLIEVIGNKGPNISQSEKDALATATKNNIELRKKENLLTQQIVDLRQIQKSEAMTIGKLLGNVLLDQRARGGVIQGLGVLTGNKESEAELKDLIKQQGFDINAPLTADQMQRAKDVYNRSGKDITEDNLMKQILDAIKLTTTGPSQNYNPDQPNGNAIIPVKDDTSTTVQSQINANSEKQLAAIEMTNSKLDTVITSLDSGNNTNGKILQTARNS